MYHISPLTALFNGSPQWVYILVEIVSPAYDAPTYHTNTDMVWYQTEVECTTQGAVSLHY